MSNIHQVETTVSGESNNLRKEWLAQIQDKWKTEAQEEEEKKRFQHEVYGCYYDTSGLEEQGDGVHGNAEQQQQN